MKTRSFFFILLFILGTSYNAQSQEGMIGEIRLFAGNFAPRNWSFCDGQLLQISSNQSLFSILGTTYGGDGRRTFALPKLDGPGKAEESPTQPNQVKQTSSLPGGRALQATFTNNTNQTVQIYWIDFSGNARSYGDLAPNRPWVVNTGTRQLWHFTRGNDLVKAIVMEEGKTSYEIKEESKTVRSADNPRYIICTMGVYPSRN